MSTEATAEQVAVNERFWRRGDHVAMYDNRTLSPVEVLILARYREAFEGRGLEVGCGAGRVLGYMAALGGEVHGIDVSEAMVEHCRRAYPEAQVHLGDMGDLRAVVDGPFDVIFVTNNTLDIYDDAHRRQVLADIRELLAADGLLVFSSHNLADVTGEAGSERTVAAERRPGPAQLLLNKSIGDLIGIAARLPARRRNRREMAGKQQWAGDHAILTEDAFDYQILHYYIRRDDQERQLREIGYELLECLDREGREVVRGQTGSGPWLHYVAKPRHGGETPRNGGKDAGATGLQSAPNSSE